MIINCKIGTGSSNVLIVKGKRKLPEKGERIKGLPISEYRKNGYNRWKEYLVTDYWEDMYGFRFYCLSL